MELLKPPARPISINAAVAELRAKLAGKDESERATEILRAKLSGRNIPRGSISDSVYEAILESTLLITPRMKTEMDKLVGELRARLIARGVDQALITPACQFYRARMTKNPEYIEFMKTRWDSLGDTGAANDAIYYAIRSARIWAADYPFDYLDIYPFVTDAQTRRFIQKFDKIKELARKLRRPELELDFPPTKFLIARKINAATRTFVRSGDGPDRITFHFDGRRIFARGLAPLGHIHACDIYYELGWRDIHCADTWAGLENVDSELAKVLTLRYRVYHDLVFDVIGHIIAESRGDIHIWLPDDRMDSISYMLVKAGRSLCTRDVRVTFESNYETIDQWDAAARAGKHIIGFKGRAPIPVQDIHSVLAIYLLHHEIYHAAADKDSTTTSAPPTYLPAENFTLPTAPLFVRLFELFQRYHPRWATLPHVEIDNSVVETGLAHIMQEASQYERGNEFVALIAAPGTGKTTFTRGHPYFVLNSDMGTHQITLRGKKLAAVAAEAAEEITRACAWIDRPRLRAAITTTLLYEYRRFYIRPYRIHMGEIERRLALQVNTIYETPGPNIFMRTRNKPAGDDCESAAPAPADELFARATQIVMFYNTLHRIYVQQLIRSSVEKRVVRYYREVDYYNNIWGGMIPPEHRPKVTIYCLDDSRNIRAVVTLGVIQAAYYDYIRAENSRGECGALVRFVEQFAAAKK